MVFNENRKISNGLRKCCEHSCEFSHILNKGPGELCSPRAPGLLTEARGTASLTGYRASRQGKAHRALDTKDKMLKQSSCDLLLSLVFCSPNELEISRDCTRPSKDKPS